MYLTWKEYVHRGLADCADDDEDKRVDTLAHLALALLMPASPYHRRSGTMRRAILKSLYNDQKSVCLRAQRQ